MCAFCVRGQFSHRLYCVAVFVDSFC